MRGSLIKKIGASAGALALSLAFAAPVLAAGTLSCAPSSGLPSTAINCTVAGAAATKAITVYETGDCTGATYGGSITGDTTTDGSGAATFSLASGFASTATYSALIDSACTNSQTYTVNTATTIAGMFSYSDMETGATTAIAQVGPWVLAVFGILLITGIAMALIKRTQRQILLEMGKTPAEIREMQRSEAAQRRAERIGKRRGRDGW